MDPDHKSNTAYNQGRQGVCAPERHEPVDMKARSRQLCKLACRLRARAHVLLTYPRSWFPSGGKLMAKQ